MNKLHRVLSWLSQHGLHLRVMMGVVIPIVIVIGVFSYIDYQRSQEMTLETLAMFSSHIGEVIQNDLRHQMLESDFEALQELLVTIGQLEGVQAVFLLDTDGKVIFASEEQIIGSSMDNRQPECTACHDFESVDRPENMVVDLPGGERVFRSAQVIDNDPVCQECHTETAQHLGVLLTDLAVAPYEATLVHDLKEHAVWWSAALVLTLGVVGLVFNRFVLLRLNALSRQITSVGEGQHVTRLPDQPLDEIGRIAAAINKMAEQVAEREADNEKLSRILRRESEQRGMLLRRLITAQESERKRVARDLHDELGQALSALSLRTQVIKRRVEKDSPEAVNQLSKIDTLIEETSAKMYDMILDLRPSVLDDLGLLPALRGHAERVFGPADIKFKIQSEGNIERLPPEIETALYRTFQEALNNVVRHAGADRVAITLRRIDGFLEGEITDNGRGFNLESVDLSGDSSRGLGLLGMRERVIQSGGELTVKTRPGAGTRIRIRMDIPDG